jgi:hypothetical protein
MNLHSRENRTGWSPVLPTCRCPKRQCGHSWRRPFDRWVGQYGDTEARILQRRRRNRKRSAGALKFQLAQLDHYRSWTIASVGPLPQLDQWRSWTSGVVGSVALNSLHFLKCLVGEPVHLVSALSICSRKCSVSLITGWWLLRSIFWEVFIHEQFVKRLVWWLQRAAWHRWHLLINTTNAYQSFL